MFDLQTDQGIKCLGVEKAGELAGNDPDYGIKDLYEAIATNNFVSIIYVYQMFARIRGGSRGHRVRQIMFANKTEQSYIP